MHIHPFSLRAMAAAGALCVAGAASALNYDVNFTAAAPAIDGHTTDTAWASASSPAGNFVAYNNLTLVSNEQTNVRALWDQTHLYLAFEATDSQVVASATGDDTGFLFSNVDNAEFFFDPSLNQLNANQNRVYHVVVDPAPPAYVFTEAGNGQLAWNLSDASQAAFSPSANGWTVEMAIAWEDFDSTDTLSPGVILGAPSHGVIWGAQFGRAHSADAVPNNTTNSKWNNEASGAYRARPIGTLTFKGGPAASKVDVSTGTVVYATGFEAPNYMDNTTVVGIDNWSAATPATWLASSEQKLTGNQSLRVAATAAGQTLNNIRQTTNSTTAQYVQYALWMPYDPVNAGSYSHVIYLQGAYTTGSLTQDMAQIWFRNNGVYGTNAISIISFETATNETLSTQSQVVGEITFNTWQYLTIKSDPVSGTIELWLNNTKLVDPVTGRDRYTVRRRSQFAQMNYAQLYSKNYGTLPFYVDDLMYVEDSQPSGVADWQLF